MTRSFVIAIDGPAASGKGTLARRLAERYGFAHLDTGALYRAVGRDVLALGGDPADAGAAESAALALDAGSLADARLRDEDVGRAASLVAVHPGVRATLLDFQRRFAAKAPGAVLDGRDIGTVICPDADLKLYVTASVEARAERRVKELERRGEASDPPAILADLAARDARDSARASAPLKLAEDAVPLDTTALDADQVFDRAVALVEARLAERASRI
ncbi:MAG TPA: d(CMP) kinase [Aliidongia sp.]|nr:d(CMP) kinase [Aliidongia sp.]